MCKMEVLRDVLIYFAGSVAIAILCWQGHLWWLERQECKAIQRQIECYWQEMTDGALDEAEAILKEAKR